MDDSWITLRINQARQAAPVADGAASAITEQLNGIMRERPMRGTELAAVAKKLIEAATDPASDSLTP